ncbi:hypothetical protein DIPPA_04813 [Diplonema papillatum]|nr:hypothetical protein DIPPA_04813 [Diplonema papillatum]
MRGTPVFRPFQLLNDQRVFNLAKLVAEEPHNNNRNPLLKLADYNDKMLTDGQVRALNTMREKKVSVVCGPPGSGKTHVVAHIVGILMRTNKLDNKHVAVIGNTKMAVERTLAAVGKVVAESVTVAMLAGRAEMPLASRAVVGMVWQSSALDDLPLFKGFSLIICDEAAGIPAAALPAVVARLADKGRLVIAGDPFQTQESSNTLLSLALRGTAGTRLKKYSPDTGLAPYITKLTEIFRCPRAAGLSEKLHGPNCRPAGRSERFLRNREAKPATTGSTNDVNKAKQPFGEWLRSFRKISGLLTVHLECDTFEGVVGDLVKALQSFEVSGNNEGVTQEGVTQEGVTHVCLSCEAVPGVVHKNKTPDPRDSKSGDHIDVKVTTDDVTTDDVQIGGVKTTKTSAFQGAEADVVVLLVARHTKQLFKLEHLNTAFSRAKYVSVVVIAKSFSPRFDWLNSAEQCQGYQHFKAFQNESCQCTVTEAGLVVNHSGHLEDSPNAK